VKEKMPLVRENKYYIEQAIYANGQGINDSLLQVSFVIKVA
jgi:hypothetical protein